MSLLDLIQYPFDLKHVILNYDTGFNRRDVVKGYFFNDRMGQNQEIMHDSLLKNGSYKTPWQVVFPDQNAGVVFKVDPPEDGMNELHIRFYHDGAISAELEYGRFSFGHWREKRSDGSSKLLEILNDNLNDIEYSKKDEISQQIKYREHNVVGPRVYENMDYMDLAKKTLFGLQYLGATALTMYLMLQNNPVAIATASVEFLVLMTPALIRQYKINQQLS